MASETDHILLDLRLDRFILSEHALERMQHRRVFRADIQEIGFSCRHIVRQKNNRWLMSGYDLDGDKLTIVVYFDGDSTVVTVMDTPGQKE